MTDRSWAEAGDAGREDEMIGGLLNQLRHEDPRVRWDTVISMVNHVDDDRVVSELARVLAEDDNYYVRLSCAFVLSRTSANEGLVALRNALKDRNYFVRAEAARSLGLIGDEDSIPDLKAAMEDTHSEVRREASLAIDLIAGGLEP